MFKLPFNPVSGQGYGVSYSSLNQIGEIFPQAGIGQANIKFYTNVSNGNLIVVDRLLKIREMNGWLTLGFIYNSLAAIPWQFTLKRFSQPPVLNSSPNQTAILMEEDGYATTYSSQQANVYNAPTLADGTPIVTFNAELNYWVWFHPGQQIVEYYNLAGFLIQRLDAAGRATIFSYDQNNQLNTITGPTGNVYQIVRDDLTLNIVEIINGQQQLLASYTLDNLGRVVTSQTPDQYVTTYQYYPNGSLLNNISQADGTSLTFGYGGQTQQQITSFRYGNILYQINYPSDLMPNNVTVSTAINQVKLTLDEVGRINAVALQTGYDASSSVTETTFYTYTPQGQLQSIFNPNGGQTTFHYDPSYGVITQKIAPNNQITQWNYYANPGLLISLYLINKNTLLNGTYQNQCFVYDTNVNNGYIFKCYEISPAGRVTQFQPDAQYSIANKRCYTSDFFSINSVPANTPISLQQMQDWSSELVQAEITLEEYIYNSHGQLINLYQYATVDENGDGVDDEQTGFSELLWDIFDNQLESSILQQTPDITSLTSRKFDGLNRLITTVDAENNLTSIQYQSVAQSQQATYQAITTYPNNTVNAKTFGNDGFIYNELVQATSGDVLQTRLTSWQRDAIGRDIITTLPDNTIVYKFYDRQNQLGFTISAAGIITQYQWDKNNNYKLKTIYNATINPTELFIIPPQPGLLPTPEKLVQQIIPQIANPDLDRSEYEFYDASNRKIFTVSALLVATQFFYDTLDRIIESIVYSVTLTPQQLNLLLQGQGQNLPIVPDFTIDRCERYFYDADGNRIASQNAAGYVTEFVFDAANRISKKIMYATPVAINLAVTDFNQIRPNNSSEDAISYFFYDARSQCVMFVDAENYLTTTSYLTCGLKQKNLRYATAINSDWLLNPSQPPALPAESTEDQTTAYSYDLLNRLVQANKPLGLMENITYDAMSNILQRATSDFYDPENLDSDCLRAEQYQFDGWNQVIAETNPFVSQILTEINSSANLTPAEKYIETQQTWQTQSLRHAFDPSGLKLYSLNPLGDITYFYYDLDRRLVVTISANGAVSEDTLNSSDEYIGRRAYANMFSTAEMTEFTGGFVSLIRETLDELQDDIQDQMIVFTRDQCGQITQKIDAEGYCSSFTFNAFGELASEYLPLTSQQPSWLICYAYDPRGLELSKAQLSDELMTITTQQYKNIYGKRTQYTDALGNVYQTEHDLLGLITAQIDPQKTLNYSYDAFSRVLSETDALGNVTTHLYDQALRLHLIIFPNQIAYKECLLNVFGEKIAEMDALGNFQIWLHAPDGKVQMFQNPVRNLTFDSYDLMGRLSSHMDANQIQTLYFYDEVSNVSVKIVDVNGLNLISNYFYDAFRNTVAELDPRSIVSIKNYDKRNLCLNQIVDPDTESQPNVGLNLTTSFSYDGQKNQIALSLGDNNNALQYQEQYVFDALSRAIGKVIDPKALKISNLNFLDNNGNSILEFDPNQNGKQKFYDDLNNVRFSIDPLGGVIEKNYDILSRLSYERKYTNPLSLNTINRLVSLEQIYNFIKPDPTDTCRWYFYDENSQLRFMIDNLDGINGRVSEARYDVAMRKIQTIAYANSITITEINSFTYDQLLQIATVIVDPNNDRINSLILDEAGQERFKIDAIGVITEQRFDGLGQVITRIVYANPVTNPAEIASMPVGQVLAEIELDPFNDQYTYQVFDSQRRPQFVVDAECYVTAYFHDQNGNLIQQIQFAEPITIPDSYANLCLLLLNLKLNPLTDRITKRVYDNANRQVQLIDSLNHADIYSLDASGNIYQHIDRNNSIWLYQIDTANRLSNEISPAIALTSIQFSNQQLSNSISTANVTNHNVYDAIGNKILVVQGYGGSEPRAMNFAYNRCNQLIGTTIQNVSLDDPNLPASFSNPPIKTSTITTAMVYDAKQQNIASQNEAGNWAFQIYAAVGNVIYAIDEAGAVIASIYNVFNEVIQETHYANILTLNLNEYTQTGIPLAIITANLVPSSADKVKIISRDQRGDPVLTVQGATTTASNNVFYCVKTSNQLSSGFANPQTKNIYDAFRRCIYELHLIDPSQDPSKWAASRTWYNRLGKPIAECDSLNRVKLYLYDAFGKIIQQVEYANPTDIAPTAATTLLEFLLTLSTSNKDKKYLRTYDLLGQLITETTQNVVIQDLNFAANNIPSLSNQAPQNLTLSYLYSNTQKKIAIIYENQAPKYFYYNARGDLIAATDVVRTSQTGNGQAITLVPLTYYSVNSFGQIVSTTRFKQGTVIPDPAQFPQPLAIDPDDQQELILFDNRGLASFKQDADNNIIGFTYIAIPKLTGREYYQLTQNIPNNPKIIHVDEKRYSYDVVTNVTQITIVRDQQTQQVTQSDYDAFRRLIAEGAGNNIWSIQYFFDNCDNCWKSNYQNGVWNIFCFDLLGHKTNTIKSATQDLSQLVYLGLPGLLQASIQTVEQTVDQRDVAGRLLARNYPSYVQSSSFNVDKMTHRQISNSADILMQPMRSYQYDAWNRKTNEIDALGNITTYTYNVHDGLISKVQPTVINVNENGISTSVNPTWSYAYDIRGFRLGYCDPNSHTTANVLDEAGQLTAKVLAEGTTLFTNVFDALGRVIQCYDPRGKLTVKTYNHRDRVVSQTTPLGRFTTYNYDELLQPNYTCLPDGSVYLYNYDACHNMQQAFLPLLQATNYIYDRNHLLLMQNNPDGSQLTWQRNYSGIPTQHTDLSGAIYYYNYDFKLQKIHEASSGGNHGKQLVFAGIENKHKHTYTNFTFGSVSGKNIYYTYAAGHLLDVNDVATGSQTQYLYDLESRPIQLLASNSSIQTRHVTTVLDALGREIYLFDTSCAITTGYDVVGNRRMIIPSFGSPAWFTYDAADRVLTDSGLLVNGVINLYPQQGMQVTYDQNFRITQTQLYLTSRQINSYLTTIQYDDDGYLTNTTTIANGNNKQTANSGREYTTNGYFYTYSNTGIQFPPTPNYSFITGLTNNYDNNSWLSLCSTVQGNTLYTTQFNNYNATGVPTSITLSSPYQTDSLNASYVGFDSWQTAIISGSSSNAGSYTSTIILYDPNGNAVTKLIQGNGAALFTSYLITNDGLPVTSVQFSATENLANIQGSGVLCIEGPQTPNITKYFYTIKGEPIASYFESSMGGSYSLVNYIRPVSDSYPPPIPPQLVTGSGMSFAAIAQAYYGDESFAAQIAYANNFSPTDVLPVGYTLQLPQIIAEKNQSGSNAPYGIFLTTILGSIYAGNSKPVAQKRRHVSELEEIAGAVVIGALGIISGGIGLAVAGVVYAEEGIIGGSLIEAAIAGISNAIIQGVAIGLGIQEHFSYRSLLSAAVIGGVTSGMQIKNLLPNVTNDSIATLLFKNGVFNAMEQLSEMAAGQQMKFDLKDLLGAMILQTLGGKISLYALQRDQQLPTWLKYLNKPWLQKTVVSMSEMTIDDVISRQYKTVEMLLTHCLGTEMGDLLGEQALQTDMIQDLEASIENYFTAANDSAFSPQQSLSRYGIFARAPSATAVTKTNLQLGLLNRTSSNDTVYQSRNSFFTTTLPIAVTKNTQSGVLSGTAANDAVNDYGINLQNYFSTTLTGNSQGPTSSFTAEFIKEWLEELQTKENGYDAAASTYDQEGDVAIEKYKNLAAYYYNKALQTGSDEMYAMADDYFTKIRFYMAAGFIAKGYDYLGKIMLAHDLTVDFYTKNWQGISEDAGEVVVGYVGSKVVGGLLGMVDALVCPPTAIGVGMVTSVAVQPALTVAGRKIGDDVYREGVRIANSL